MKLSVASRRHAGVLPNITCPRQLLHRRIPAQQLWPTIIKQHQHLQTFQVSAAAYAASSIELEAARTTSGSRRAPAAADTITLPLDYYSCLGLSKSCSHTSVRQAYERVLSQPPDVGYSQDTLFYRAVLLRAAAECLGSLPSRRAYDSSGCNVAVSMHNLPAALVLLQESGESGLVVELGSSWLQQHSTEPFAPDVATSVALAHCDEAAAALDADGGTVVLQACRRLERALQLLREYKMAANLQHLIMQTLEDYSPRYALELLALPLEQQQQRQRGFSLLRKLAWELPPKLSPVGSDRDGFLAKARSAMMPQELLDLYKSLPSGVQLSAFQRLDIALATAAIGYQRHQPHLVQRAASLFQQLGEAADKDRAMDVSLERAACALLLGNAPQALQLLGLADAAEGQQGSCEDSVREFVLAHSPDSSDLLPGLYVLSQAWLQEAVVGGFRPDAFEGQAAADLGQWFAARRVQLYIQVLAAVRNLPQFVTQTIPAAVAAFFVWLVKSAWDRLLGSLPSRNSSSGSLQPTESMGASSTPHSSTPVQEEQDDIVYHQAISSRPSSPTPRTAALAAAAVAGPAAAAAVLEQAAAGAAARSASAAPISAEDEEQQLLLEADAAELEFSLCLRLKNQPAAGQDEQQQAQQRQGALFGAKRGPAATPDEAARQMKALEMQMWDSLEPEQQQAQGRWAALAHKAWPALLLAAAAAAALLAARCAAASRSVVPAPAAALWETARC